jgi:DNA-binding LacI/PurR family transcriptional regulator
VLALAAQLGYRHLRPTIRKRNSPRKELTLVGVMIESNDPQHLDIPLVSRRILRGVSEAVRMERVAIHVEYVPVQDAAEVHLPERQPVILRKGHLSGLLLVGRYSVPAVRALSRQLPCVRLNVHEPELDVDCVGQHDLDAVDKLVEHLSGLGHQQFGFLSEPPHFWPIQARLAGYSLALARRGLTYVPERVVVNPTPSAAGAWEKAHGQVLEQVRKGVRAWICNHDDVGYNLLRFLRNHGLAVPQDISLCGFDDLDAEANLPKMTSIDWPFEDIGATGVRRLLRRGLDLTTAPLHLMLRGRLVPGASSAAVTADRQLSGLAPGDSSVIGTGAGSCPRLVSGS